MPSNKTLNEKKREKKQKRQRKNRPLKGVIFSSTISPVMFSCLEIGRLPVMMTQIPILLTIYALYRVFLHDVTAAMLVFQTNPVGVQLFSYGNAFFWSNKFA